MAPDADAGKSLNARPDPFAPLTSQLPSVGDGHEVYVESVGRADDRSREHHVAAPRQRASGDRRALIVSAGLGHGAGSLAEAAERAAQKYGMRLIGPNCLRREA
jgi:hypothetical protein